MKLSEMRQVLEERGIQLTKSLGQNFLHDGNQLRRIVAAADLQRDDRVLEIGPGLGPLTEALLGAAAEVLAIEKDSRLVEVLQHRFQTAIETNRLRLRHEDALDHVKAQRQWAGWKLVSNLPYSVGSPILVELAMALQPPERMVATLQAEVVDRLMARPGQDDYGLLTVLVGAAFEPLDAFKIPRSCFFPAPDVDSACITLGRRKAPLVSAPGLATFVQLVKLAFSQRRKMMFKLLKARFGVEPLTAAFQKTGLALDVRAETVSIELFAELSKILLRHE